MSGKLTDREKKEITQIEDDIRAEETRLSILRGNREKDAIPISEKKIKHLKHRLLPLKEKQTKEQTEIQREAEKKNRQREAEKREKQNVIDINRANILKYLLRGDTMKQIIDLNYDKLEILKVLIDNNFSLEQIKSYGFNEEQILNVLTSRKTPLNEIFNSRFKFTYGYLKKHIDKSDKEKYDLFNAFSKSIEGPDKCVKDGAFGMIGSKAACYYDSTKNIYKSKGGRTRRSHRKQYRRSRKISKK